MVYERNGCPLFYFPLSTNHLDNHFHQIHQQVLHRLPFLLSRDRTCDHETTKQQEMSEITHIMMYSKEDVSITSFCANGEDGVSLDFAFDAEIRCSILGNLLTIEDNSGDPVSLNGEIKLPRGTTLRLKSVVVMGCGLLTFYAEDANHTLTIRVYNAGGVDLKVDYDSVFTKLQLSNHGSGSIRGFGSRTEILKIQNTGSGVISGFLAEKEVIAIISGSGDTRIGKFANCLAAVNKIPHSTGKIKFV